MKSRRWNAFVCPECRHVFRVPANHDGKGIVCPCCHRVLRLPKAGDEVPPLVIQTHDGPRAESADELRARQEARVFDETFTDKQQGTDTTVKRMVITTGIILVLAILTGIFWPRDRSTPSDRTPSDLEEEFLNLTTTGPEDEGPESDILSTKAAQTDLEPVVRSFMEAESAEEAADFVRHPEVTHPRMEAHHTGIYRAPRLHSIVWSKIMRRHGKWATLTVEDGEFDKRTISLAHEDGEWKVDWESFVGWSEISWRDLKTQRPTEPVLLRVMLNDVDYYNFDFSDESKWSSYTLLDAGKLESIYGYVPSLGELDLRLRPDADARDQRFILRVRFPEESASSNQVLIEEIVAEGWLDPEDTP